MARRRGNGEGSIYQRSRDKRWVAVVTLGWKSDGNLDRKTFVSKSRAEVVGKLEAAKRALAEGNPIKFEAQTLAVFLRRWLEDAVKVARKPKTVASYEWALKHIEPAIGHIQLHKLAAQDIQRFVNEKSAALSPKSVKIIRDTLRAALNRALLWSLVAKNVAQHITLPRLQREEKRVWSAAEANAFLTSIVGHRLEAAFRLALCFGVRQGEILGLQWADVDFERQCLYVRRTQHRVDGELVTGSPKTESSRRRIRFALGLAELLSARRRAQDDERNWAAGDWVESGVVFCTSRGTRQDADNLRRLYRAAVKRAKLDYIPFHRLRHTTASLLHEHGLSSQEIRMLLGHSSALTTESVYMHATPDTEAALVRGIETVFSPAAVSVAVKGKKSQPN